MRSLAIAAMAMILAGCVSAPEQLQSVGDRNYMRYAMGKPYAQVAAQNPMSLEGMMGSTIYGEMIGAYTTEGGDRIYRHIANVESSRSSVNAGIVMRRENISTRYRLAYFRVGPDGIVRDWATGTLAGEQMGCVWYAAGIVRRCSSDNEIRQSLAVYDSLVRTSDNRPLSDWGMPVEGAS